VSPGHEREEDTSEVGELPHRFVGAFTEGAGELSAVSHELDGQALSRQDGDVAESELPGFESPLW
jgi:hypothetical protein